MTQTPGGPEDDKRADTAAPPGSIWHWARAAVGRVLLRICRVGPRDDCANPHCRFQPFCACARAELALGRRVEGRLWRTLAVCGGLLVLGACCWALLAHR